MVDSCACLPALPSSRSFPLSSRATQVPEGVVYVGVRLVSTCLR